VNKPKPHVIMIAYYFPPSPEIGARRPARFHKWLQRMGYRCHVVTAAQQGENSPADVHFIADETYELWDKGRGKRSLKFYFELLVRQLMFPGHIGIVWSRKAAAQVSRIVREHPDDSFVMFSTYPPLGTLLAGLTVHRKMKIPWIADFRDPMASLLVDDEPAYWRFWTLWLEKQVVGNASVMVANTDTAAKAWSERYPWARQKVRALYNGFDPEDCLAPRPIPERSRKIILHAGTFYHGRNPNIVLESMARLREQNAPEAEAAKILLLGTSSNFAGANAPLYERGQREGWLELRDAVPRPEAEKIIEEADGLLLFQGHSSVQVPGKLYEYICVGRPVLALLLRPSPVEPILEKCGVAHVCVYTDDPPEVADRKLLEFLRLPNTAAPINDWFGGNFNSKVQTEKLAEMIEEIRAG
jgi:glycosyltransferase involved in cell wall biosynthesis